MMTNVERKNGTAEQREQRNDDEKLRNEEIGECEMMPASEPWIRGAWRLLLSAQRETARRNRNSV